MCFCCDWSNNWYQSYYSCYYSCFKFSLSFMVVPRLNGFIIFCFGHFWTLFPWNNWERKSTSGKNERKKPQHSLPSKCPCILWYVNIEAVGFPFWLKWEKLMICVGKLPMQASFRDSVRCIIRSVEINFIFQKYTLPEEWPYQVIVTANATLFVLVGGI